MLVSVVISFGGWLAMVSLMEYLLQQNVSVAWMSTNLVDARFALWCCVGVVAFSAGGPDSLPHLLVGLPVAASHVDLARNSNGTVTWRQILRHMWKLVVQAVAMIAS